MSIVTCSMKNPVEEPKKPVATSCKTVATSDNPTAVVSLYNTNDTMHPGNHQPASVYQKNHQPPPTMKNAVMCDFIYDITLAIKTTSPRTTNLQL